MLSMFPIKRCMSVKRTLRSVSQSFQCAISSACLQVGSRIRKNLHQYFDIKWNNTGYAVLQSVLIEAWDIRMQVPTHWE